MHNCNVVVVALCSLIMIMCCANAAADEPALNTARTKAFMGVNFHSDDFGRTLEYLRSLGKEKALAELRKYYQDAPLDTARNNDVLLLCRALFDNPKGWPPVIEPGIADPEVVSDATKIYPHFPVAYSDGIPFLLIKDYHLGGRGLSASQCIDESSAFELRKNGISKYSVDNASRAAKKLIASEEFRHLYKTEKTVEEMSQFVIEQARPSDINTK